ncbi:MAG: PilZ domain-containing protein [Legionella sp.]|nr:PilZ domain-containing protein [Legionella sp.]
MAADERRQHCRIDDHIYFDYRIIKPNDCSSELGRRNELLGESGQKYIETLQYFQTIDSELAKVGNITRDPAVLQFLHLINAKIDYLSRQMMIPPSINIQKVNISLGGLAFKTSLPIKEGIRVKTVIYTKPKMIPIIVDARVVYCQYQFETYYRTAIAFDELTLEQEQLLSQHILLSQAKCLAE